MPIYTKTGDRGETSLFGGKRVAKSDLQVEAYGSVDELTSFIGLVIAKTVDPKQKAYLTSIQKDLYVIMSVLAGDTNKKTVSEKKINDFERLIDKIGVKLPALHGFILPQGSEISAWFQILRVICRRAERKVVLFSVKIENLNLKIIIKYLNRLSDLFFVLARYYNKEKEIEV